MDEGNLSFINLNFLEFETLAKTDVSKMKSNKRIFEENNKELKDKVSGINNFNSKTTTQSIKKAIPIAEKNNNLNKNELKDSNNRSEKNNNNLNVVILKNLLL